MGFGAPSSAVTVFPSAARTATVTSDLLRIRGRGVLALIDVTAVTATPSVVFSIEITEVESISGVETMLDSAPVTATGTTLLVVHPLVPTTRANLADVGPLGAKWRITATHADADSITYSVTVFPLR